MRRCPGRQTRSQAPPTSRRVRAAPCSAAGGRWRWSCLHPAPQSRSSPALAASWPCTPCTGSSLACDMAESVVVVGHRLADRLTTEGQGMPPGHASVEVLGHSLEPGIPPTLSAIHLTSRAAAAASLITNRKPLSCAAAHLVLTRSCCTTATGGASIHLAGRRSRASAS